MEEIINLQFSNSSQAQSTLSHCLIRILCMVLILETSSIFKEQQDFETDMWEIT